MDEVFRIFGNSDDAVGSHETVIFNFVDYGIATMHAGAVKFGGVDMGNEGSVIFFFGDKSGLVGQPIVSVDDVGMVMAEILIYIFTIFVLDVANGNWLIGAKAGNDFFKNLHGGVAAATITKDGVKVRGVEDFHKINVRMLGGVGNDEIYLRTITSKSVREI